MEVIENRGILRKLLGFHSEIYGEDENASGFGIDQEDRPRPAHRPDAGAHLIFLASGLTN
jgi:hypothetical protein